MSVDPLLVRWPGLSPVSPRVPTTEELLARDEATASAIRAYLETARPVPAREGVAL